MLLEHLLGIFSLFQLGVDLLNAFAQCLVGDVVDEEHHDLVEGELLTHEVGADANERDHFDGRSGFLLVSEQPPPDIHHLVSHLLEGDPDLCVRERLLLAVERLFFPLLYAVQERHALVDASNLELPFPRHLLRLVLGQLLILGADDAGNDLAGRRQPINPKFCHGFMPPDMVK